MTVPNLVQGRIVWASLLDRNRVNRKYRPTVLLQSDDKTPAGEPLLVVVVSTTFDLPPPADHVLLPYSNDRLHPAMTGLDEQGAAICTWLEELPRDTIRPHDIRGIVPPRLMKEIVEKVLAMNPPDS
jgi:mRNA-degrading endonuclease toxin of MazEF toxin-antitoxin module